MNFDVFTNLDMLWAFNAGNISSVSKKGGVNHGGY